MIFINNGIKAILFDLDGTLRYNRPSSLQFFLDSAVKLGLEDSPEKRRQAIRWAHYYWAQSTHLIEDLKLYNDKDEQFLDNYSRKFLIAFGCEPELAEELAYEINHKMFDTFDPVDSLAEDAFELLDYLKAHRFRMAIVTNRRESCQEQLNSLGLTPYFEFTLVAGELDVWKPEAGIFLHALERFNINADEALYIGDNYYSDVVGAQSAGILPILIDPEDIFQGMYDRVIHRLGELISLI